jgi:dethiobiotin synthetase
VSALLVTGTDTGVGKTFVACALALALRRRACRVAVLKPVETGVESEPEDAARLRAAAADPAPLDVVCPYGFRAPLAPVVAARREGRAVDVDAIAALVQRRAAEADLLLIEGAGGLLVPLAGRTTYADLAARLGLPLLVVAANRLGTINHCALTAQVAAAAGLRVHGFVLSQPEAETDPSAGTNAGVIADLTGLSCLAVLGHLPSPAAAASALDAFAERLASRVPTAAPRPARPGARS